MPNNDVHPDLQRIARFTPRRLVGPRKLALMRASPALPERRTPTDVEVIT